MVPCYVKCASSTVYYRSTEPQLLLILLLLGPAQTNTFTLCCSPAPVYRRRRRRRILKVCFCETWQRERGERGFFSFSPPCLAGVFLQERAEQCRAGHFIIVARRELHQTLPGKQQRSRRLLFITFLLFLGCCRSTICFHWAAAAATRFSAATFCACRGSQCWFHQMSCWLDPDPPP